MKKHPIFVLDDHHDTLEMIDMVLVSQGYPVMVCDDTERALQELAKCQQPCVLLLDHSLLKPDPLDFIQKVRNINNPVHFILMTGLNAKLKAEELGLDHYVQKPFDPIALLEMIHKLYSVCGTPSVA